MKYLTLMLLIGCSVRKPPASAETMWKSAKGNLITMNGDIIIYDESKCYILGTYKKTYDNYLTWDISINTCSDDTGLNSCYFAKNSYGEHANFVCFDLGLGETFYRIK